MTIVELTVAVSVFAVVGTFIFLAVGAFVTDQAVTANRALANQLTSSVLSGLQAEIGNAGTLYNPATEGTNGGTNPDGTSVGAGWSVRFYVPPAPTAATGTAGTCWQWRLLDTGVMQTRSWVNGASTANPWSNYAKGFANTSSQAPFALDSSSNFGQRLLNVDLYFSDTGKTGSTIQELSSVAALDGYFSTTTSPCSTVPTP